MIKDITMGQYFPGNSLIHRLDPRMKIIMVIIYIAALFTAKSYVSYAVMLGFLITCIAISKIKFKTLLKGMKPLILIVIITGFLNLFLTNGCLLYTSRCV